MSDHRILGQRVRGAADHRAARTSLLLVSAALAGCAVLAACSSGDASDSAGATTSSTSSAPPSTPGYCADAEQLQASVQALTQVDVGQSGLPALKTALQDVQTKASTLAAEAQQELAPQTSALEQSLTGLGTASDAAAATPSATTIAGVVTALQQVKSAAAELSAATSGKCS